MKKSLLWLFVVVLSVSMVAAFSLVGCKAKTAETTAAEGETVAETPAEETVPEGEQVTIKLTSWRTEDIERMNTINAVFMEKNPDIIVDFQPIKDTEYDAQLTSSLETGVGADIIWLRSFDPGELIYNGGYISKLNDVIPELSDFPSAAINAWASDDGVIYGVPIAGVTHGVYYLGDIFDKYGLEEPATWAEFMDLCKTLKDNGETVFAQGTGDGWPLYEVIYSGLGANFYGGEASRQALMAGDMRLTDEPFVNAFKAEDQLQQFFPDGYEAINYVAMQQMFGTRQAAMYIGGSWEIGLFEDSGLTDLGWFAPPVENAGDTLQYCFHVDMGVGINKDSKNYDAALRYLKWTSTPEFAQLFMDNLPGFFSYTPNPTGEYTLENLVAKDNLDAAKGADITVRTVWERMSRQDPSGNGMMEEALIKMLTDVLTPEEAAALVQDALNTWYKPFMK
jgi:raffinose/stachyose/melibiose transport system substrate-binding protein